MDEVIDVKDFRRGDGSERAVGGHDTSSNRLRFFAGLTIRIACARDRLRMSGLRSASVALSRERRSARLWLRAAGRHPRVLV